MHFARPSPRLLNARLTQLGLTTLVGVAAIIALLVLGLAVIALLGVVVLVVAVGIGLVVSVGRYRAWGYLERAEDLVVQRGVMVRRISVVPYGRLQFIDVSAGPVDRLFGLGTVQLHTAAAATDARIPGLMWRDAEALRDRLTQLGESRSTGL